MKKKVSFQKKIEFPSMIGDVSAIALDSKIIFIDESNCSGDLILSGKYKLTEASRLEEDFLYKIPTEISLTEKIDLNTAKVEISDFSYEIENEDTMVCNIELTISGLELIELEDERECDGEVNEQLLEDLPMIEKVQEDVKSSLENEERKEVFEDENSLEQKKEEKLVTEEKEKTNENQSIFINISEDAETYGTFLVYIIRQNESINNIIEKYNTSIEELEKYNNLNDLSIGTKLIIPLLND